MMTTALLAFFGLSACATLFIVAAVALNARSGTASQASSFEMAESSVSPSHQATIVPAFSL